MQNVCVGIDIGSVSAKAAVVGEGGAVLYKESCRTLGRPVETARSLLDTLKEKGFSFEEVVATGSGARLLSGRDIGAKVVIVNEFKSIVTAVGRLYPNVRTIFEMGGESSKFIKLSTPSPQPSPQGGEGDCPLILEYGINGDCAAGTGSFIDQQAERLHYRVEDVGPLVVSAQKGARIAGRCSVFAKSDMIHAQQKGYLPEEVLKGLCTAVVRNYKATIVKGRHVTPGVVFIGGLALNAGIVNAIREQFDLKEDELIVPEEAEFIGAIGAGMAGFVIPTKVGIQHLQQVLDPSAILTADKGLRQGDGVLSPLSTSNVRFLRDRVKPYKFPDEGRIDVFLGIDIGSVSTNFVVLDKAGDMVLEIYTYTKARPIEIVSAGLKEIESAIGGKITIRGVGTTGSGRELIGELIGADVVKDEITAHKTGAVHICQKMTGENVDTIFEIGGQDAKYIRIENGIVTDFAMNEACAAGTGSFLEEQANRLGISIKNEFADMALASKSPIPLGERCTVFMERDVNAYQLKGAGVGDIVAGLAYSVATNYLNRVVRGRKIGDHIFFQGGTAYNDAVAAAFSQILGKTITVPPHNGVIGAIGAALLAQEAVKGVSKFRGFQVDNVNYTMREFSCNACTNSCDIQEFNVEGEKTYWGDKCSSRFRKKAHTDNTSVINDLFKMRKEMLDEVRESADGKPTIGIPRTMFYFDRFPFWRAYFETMGFNVVTSHDTNKTIAHDSLELTIAEPCYPIKLAHGHIADLEKKGVDYIFVPNVITSDAKGEPGRRTPIPYLCPWHQTLPFVLKASAPFSGLEFLTPKVEFDLGPRFVSEALWNMSKGLGIDKKTHERALDAAYTAQADFSRNLQELGREALAEIEKKNAPGVVLVGRPYNIYDTGANLNVPVKLREFYGINVIPFDFLPLDDVDVEDVTDNMFWNYGRKIVAAAKFVAERPNLHMIYITNFKCGPDSFIKHFSTWAAGKPYLTLQFDEHSNDAGTVTRIEAYLDSKGLLGLSGGRKKWDYKQKTTAGLNFPSFVHTVGSFVAEPFRAPPIADGTLRQRRTS